MKTFIFGDTPMRRYLVIACCMLVITSVVHGQSLVRTGGKITVAYGKDQEKPLGKNVSVEYDEFFKSYKVTYTTVDGIKKKMLFEFYSDEGNWQRVRYDGRIYAVTNILGKKTGDQCPDMISFGSSEKYQTDISYSIDFCDPKTFFQKSSKKK